MECQSRAGTQMLSPLWGLRCFLVMQLCCSSLTLGALGIFCPFTPPHPLAPLQIPWLLTISLALQVCLLWLFLFSTSIFSSWIFARKVFVFLKPLLSPSVRDCGKRNKKGEKPEIGTEDLDIQKICSYTTNMHNKYVLKGIQFLLLLRFRLTFLAICIWICDPHDATFFTLIC